MKGGGPPRKKKFGQSENVKGWGDWGERHSPRGGAISYWLPEEKNLGGIRSQKKVFSGGGRVSGEKRGKESTAGGGASSLEIEKSKSGVGKGGPKEILK